MRHSKIKVPTAAAQVLQAAREAGWETSATWGKDSTGYPLYRVCVAHPEVQGRGFAHAVLVWHTDVLSGSFSVTNAVLRTNREGQWQDLRTVKLLTTLIRSGALTQDVGELVRA